MAASGETTLNFTFQRSQHPTRMSTNILRRGPRAGTSVYSPSVGNQTEYFPSDNLSKDRLTLNVLAPLSAKKSLPVFAWYCGGGFVQEHIVVTVNFRSNIFGFANAAGLNEQNLGLLDQRLALEWVRDNIVNFGGDPPRIIGWGQSGGAIAVDYLNFAYTSDPVYSGMILDSSTALYPQKAVRKFDIAQTNFTDVAAALGCNNATTQVDCLKEVPWQEIEALLSTDPTLNFIFIVGDHLVFSNYTKRHSMNALSTVPTLIGTNEREFNEGVPTRLGPSYNQPASDHDSNEVFLCTAARASHHRQSRSLISTDTATTATSPISRRRLILVHIMLELPSIFGIAGEYHGKSSDYEETVGRKMQDLWLEFGKDPEHGLLRAGWGTYSEGKAVLLGGAENPLKEINLDQLDGYAVRFL